MARKAGSSLRAAEALEMANKAGSNQSRTALEMANKAGTATKPTHFADSSQTHFADSFRRLFALALALVLVNWLCKVTDLKKQNCTSLLLSYASLSFLLNSMLFFTVLGNKQLPLLS